MRVFKSILILLLTTNFCLAVDSDSLNYFRKSIEEVQAGLAYAEKISEVQDTTFTISEEQVNKIIYHSKKALEYSNKVLDEDLNKLDRSLFYKTVAKKYENLFREGLRLHISAWEEGDTVKGVKANKLLNNWAKYYNKLRKKYL